MFKILILGKKTQPKPSVNFTGLLARVGGLCFRMSESQRVPTRSWELCSHTWGSVHGTPCRWNYWRTLQSLKLTSLQHRAQLDLKGQFLVPRRGNKPAANPHTAPLELSWKTDVWTGFWKRSWPKIREKRQKKSKASSSELCGFVCF